MSTTFNKIVLGSVATFATVATLVPAQQANAAALKGSFLFDAQDGNEEVQDTMATLNEDSVNFTPEENAFIDLKFQSGSFVDIENALISDITDLATSGNPLVGEFLTFNDNEGGEGPATFSITEASDYLNFESEDGLITVDLKLEGFFTSSTGDISKGHITLSFDTIGEFNSSKDFDGQLAAFSGGSVATVPEPTTMAGLSMVAVGMALAGRRKKA